MQHICFKVKLLQQVCVLSTQLKHICFILAIMQQICVKATKCSIYAATIQIFKVIVGVVGGVKNGFL